MNTALQHSSLPPFQNRTINILLVKTKVHLGRSNWHYFCAADASKLPSLSRPPAALRTACLHPSFLPSPPFLQHHITAEASSLTLKILLEVCSGTKNLCRVWPWAISVLTWSGPGMVRGFRDASALSTPELLKNCGRFIFHQTFWKQHFWMPN